MHGSDYDPDFDDERVAWYMGRFRERYPEFQECSAEAIKTAAQIALQNDAGLWGGNDETSLKMNEAAFFEGTADVLRGVTTMSGVIKAYQR